MFKYKNSAIIISWIVAFLWMALIFNLSSQPATQSKKLSKGITEVVIETVERITPNKADEIDIGVLNHLIRKNAHFFAYLVLGILVLNALRQSEVLGIKGIILAFLICVLYAVSDEVHQAFVPGRGPQVKDVLLDSTGVFVGVLIYLGFQVNS